MLGERVYWYLCMCIVHQETFMYGGAPAGTESDPSVRLQCAFCGGLLGLRTPSSPIFLHWRKTGPAGSFAPGSIPNSILRGAEVEVCLLVKQAKPGKIPVCL